MACLEWALHIQDRALPSCSCCWLVGITKRRLVMLQKKWADLSCCMCLRENSIQSKNKRANIWNYGCERNAMAYCVWKAFLKCRDDWCGQQLTLGLNSFTNPWMGGQSLGWAHTAEPVLLIQLFLFGFQHNLMCLFWFLWIYTLGA